MWLSEECELFCACALASLGLHIAPENDINIFKVLVLAKAVISVVTYFGKSTGWFEPVNHRKEKRHLTVEYVLGVTSCLFLFYCYIF